MKAVFTGKNGSHGLEAGIAYKVEPYGFSDCYIAWLSEKRVSLAELYCSGALRAECYSIVPKKRFCMLAEWRQSKIEQIGI